MKQGIHPDYVECTVKCTCGNVFTTRSTKSELKIDICNKCHPFFTGTQKLIDTGGRVQRFADKFGSAADMVAKAEAEKKAAVAELQGSIADLSVDVASRLVGHDLNDDEHRKIIEHYVTEAGSFNA